MSDREAEIRADIPAVSEEILHGLIGVLGEYPTDTLRGVAALRDTISPGGWVQGMLREYLDVWR